MTYPVCPCDADPIVAPVNLPELTYISYRVGTYVSFRQAVLTPLFVPGTPMPLPVEQTLSVDGKPVWRTTGAGDLAVMIAEWFAYIADIITFYNERIANQDYLRTASLPESVNNLIALLGYRPRPAIGAYGTLAALLSPGPSFGNGGIVLPQGLQFQSKPTPGLTPQFFELLAQTTITAPGQLPAAPAPVLLQEVPNPWTLGNLTGAAAPPPPVSAFESLLLQGSVTSLNFGDYVILGSLVPFNAGPWLAVVWSATPGPSPSGAGQQTEVILFWSADTPPQGTTSAQAVLQRPNQTANAWSFFTGAISGATVHLASLVRQIQPGDWLLFTAAENSPGAVLAQVQSVAEMVWDANAGPTAANATIANTSSASTNTASPPVTTTTTTVSIPIPHTVLTMANFSGWDDATGVSVRFGWVSVGTLLDQPYDTWSGSPQSLVATSAQNFPAWDTPQPILLQDANGAGLAASARASNGGQQLTLSNLTAPLPQLQPPFLVLPNLLPVTRGKTVANEVLGSGDPTNPAQDFQLSQSPVTYLMQGAGYASTIQLTVNNLPWTEVPSFYGKSPDATVFVTREDNQGITHVMFGDGVNGARLPSGMNNIVATYRVGAGAASPPAGKLTVIAQSYPGLRSVLNPVAVIGGADADLPAQIVHDAPRSVLTFGRAVSVFDYQALAAQVPSVTRASAIWAWDAARQRSLVTVYVGDTPGAAEAAKKALASVGDPNRPVRVKPAIQIAVTLGITLVVVPGMDTTIIGNAVTTALTDTEVGLFGAWNIGIGQTLFKSQIEEAVLGVQGAVAITALGFKANGAAISGALYLPGEDGFFTLDPSDINLVTESDPNG